MALGVKVIHCSEPATRRLRNSRKQVDEFVNTWSVEGFREEGTTTAEMGWGTHEKELPPLAYRHKRGPGNQICLGADGDQYLGGLLGARLLHSRHGRPPRRGVHHLRQTDGMEEGQGGLPAHGSLRVLSLRQAAIASLT